MLFIYIVLAFLITVLFYLKNNDKENNRYLTPKKNLMSTKGKNSTINKIAKNFNKKKSDKENYLNKEKKKGFQKITENHIEENFSESHNFREKKNRVNFRKSKYM